ncbi:MAG: phosphoribosylanthranilate isomerase [Flavobacteriaceae bacterium]
MKLKVCGMKYSQNITEIENLFPDLMGFIFYEKSKRFFNQPEINLNNKVKRVGVFVNENIQEIKNKIKKYKLDYVQLHGEENVNFCHSLKPFVKIIKVFKIDYNFNFKKTEEFEEVCDYFLFDTKSQLHGGSGKKFDWDLLKNYNCKKDFFLSGGIDISDIEEIKKIVNSYPIAGIDVNSKFELDNLEKDKEKINLLIKKLRL